jgi:alpha-glucosidase
VAVQEVDPHSMLSLYRALIALRSGVEALVSGELKLLPTAEPVLAYERNLGGQRLTVVLNMSDRVQLVVLQGSSRRLLLSTFLDVPVAAQDGRIHLRANEGLIFREP